MTSGYVRAGDVVAFDGELFEVVGQPFLGQSGASVFDVPELFWRARVRPLSGDRRSVHLATWRVDEEVLVLDIERRASARVKIPGRGTSSYE
jgi:hypothetical protein